MHTDFETSAFLVTAMYTMKVIGCGSAILEN